MNTPQATPPSDEALERFIAGDATEIERAAVSKWLSADPSRALRIDSIRSELKQPAPSAPDVDAAFGKLRQRHETSRFESRGTPRWNVATFASRHKVLLAASVAVVIGAAIWAGGRNTIEISAPAEWTVSTAAGETRKVTLADGSVIDMAPRTRIQYGERSGNVSVTLSGMAGFTVVHNPDRQFRISAGNAEVLDIGTEFAVRSYDADSTSIVFVKSGKVAVSPLRSASSRTGPSSRELGAGQAIAVSDNGALIEGATVISEISNYEAELHGRLAFEGRTVESVASTLSNWFGVRVVIRDPSLGSQHVTAMFNKPDLHEILDAIAETTGSRYRIAGDTITFSERR